jgi:HAD superfamily hydrolase (TIGR01509 family)
VVFDCDGTLVDTEPLSERAWTEVLAHRGYATTAQDFDHVLGRHDAHSYAYFDERTGGLGDPGRFRTELREVFYALFDRELEVFDDVVATIRELAAAGVPVAVASSSLRSHVERVMERCGLTDVVRAALGSDDTSEHKPHPAPYLTAAQRLGVEAERCTAVEDTRVGIASARAAGMFTVAVRRPHIPEADLAAAHRRVDQLSVEALLP